VRRDRGGPALVRSSQSLDADLLHLEHRGHDAPGLFRVSVVQHLDEGGGHDLPRDAESVLEPATLHGLAAGGQLLPEVIDLVLGLAAHDEGDRLASSVEREVLVTLEFAKIET
jgi:hypothetical protein